MNQKQVVAIVRQALKDEPQRAGLILLAATVSIEAVEGLQTILEGLQEAQRLIDRLEPPAS